jgi:hypothetical protein
MTPERDPIQVGQKPWTWRTWRSPVAIIVWIAIALVVLNGVARAVAPGSQHLRLIREISGTVTLLNFNAAKFCLETDTSRTQYCSAVVQQVGSAPLVVGEHVTGTVAQVWPDPSSGLEVFVVTDPAPSP